MVMFLRREEEEEEEREKDNRITDYFEFLPLEMKLDILTRLPTEFVIYCKSVSTNWRSVIAHPSFSKMHFHHQLNHPSSQFDGKLGFLVLTSRHDRSYYVEYNQNHDQSTPPIQRIAKINFTPPFKHFRFLGSINGLVCLLNYPYDRPRSVWICNPITRECVMLPENKKDSDIDGYRYENSGFGYVSSTNEYKVVTFYKSETHLEVHIYTLGSGNGWRNLGKFNFGSESLSLGYRIFFANGHLYWGDEELKIIIIFDLSEEKFGEHFSPPPLPNSYWYDIGVMNGSLFFVLQNEEDRSFNDIWLLKRMNHNHGKEEGADHQSLGWNKVFKIDYSDSFELLSITKSDGVFTYNASYLNIYDTKTLTSKSLVKFTSYIAQVCAHKNTLVSLKELGEEDAKIMKSAQIEEIKRHEQQQGDADPEYIYL